MTQDEIRQYIVERCNGLGKILIDGWNAEYPHKVYTDKQKAHQIEIMVAAAVRGALIKFNILKSNNNKRNFKKKR